MKHAYWYILVAWLTCSTSDLQHANAADADVTAMDQAFTGEIQPLLKAYCVECHSGELPDADIDLTLYKSLSDIRRHTKEWQKGGHMLDSGQMPPKKA